MMRYCIFLYEYSPIPVVLFLFEFLFCYFSAGMVARASKDSNLNGDDGQANAPIQQQIVSLSIQMIVANAAGKGGRAKTGGGDNGGGKSARPGCAANDDNQSIICCSDHHQHCKSIFMYIFHKCQLAIK
jgi:hypothetical protein